MFLVKIGPVTTEVECPLIEDMAEAVARTEEKVDSILELIGGGTTPKGRIEFTIGPVTEQKE